MRPGLFSLGRARSSSCAADAPKAASAAFASSALSPDGASFFVGSSRGRIQALLAQSGHQRWLRRIGDRRIGELLPSPDGAALVAGATDAIHAFEAASGETRWEHALDEGAALRHVTVSRDGASVFVGTSEGELMALSAADGAIRWFYRVGEATPEDWSFIVSADGSTLLCWAGDGQLHAVAAASGDGRWMRAPGGGSDGACPNSWELRGSPDGSLVSYVSQDNRRHAVRVATGETAWSSAVPGPGRAQPRVFCTTPDGAAMLCGTADGKLETVHSSSGEVIWTKDFGHASPVSCFVSRDGTGVFVADSAGTLHAMEAISGALRWSWDSEDSGLRLLTVDTPVGSLFCQDSAGEIHALDLREGTERWVHRASEAPIAATLAPDGAALLLALPSGGVSSIEASSGKVKWAQAAGEASQKSAAEGNVLSGSAWLRNKRYAVVIVLFVVWELRRSGKLRRPSGGEEPQLADVLGGPAAALLQKELSASATVNEGGLHETQPKEP